MFSIGQRFEDYEIVGKITAKSYAAVYAFNMDTSNWDKVDKNWRDKYVYFIKFNKPRKNMSIEDVQFYNPSKNYKEIEEIYEALPFYSYMCLLEQTILENALNDKTNVN